MVAQKKLMNYKVIVRSMHIFSVNLVTFEHLFFWSMEWSKFVVRGEDPSAQAFLANIYICVYIHLVLG